MTRSNRARALMRRVLALGASSAVVAAGLISMTAAPAAAAACTVSFDTTVSDAGFTHPGIGLTAENLETAREQIASGTEPWASYFEDMKKSPAAAIDAASANESKTQPGAPDSTAFDSPGFNSRFIGDALKAYTQSILYAVTGEQEYRTNAMEIIRIWEQMDPDDYAVFPDSHIHTGIPLNRMTAAAEILRYGSCEGDELAWTDADTEAFTTNLIEPVTETFLHDQNHFMNQHTYPLLGAMAGYIFTENRERYDEAVEWFTVNSTAENQGFNGSVAQLFRLVETDDKTGEKLADPRVQHVEMGRDQAHGGGDITNASILSRMMMAQGTNVDPVAGTVSTARDAVGPFEFGDDRILAAADYFWSFMLGHDPEWTPVGYSMDPDGTVRDTYDHISNAYRGRYNTASVWDLYYYYAYTRGEDMTEIAPNLEAAFEQRLPLEYYYGGALTRAWDSPDAGGDFWLYLPESAAGSSVPTHMTSPTVLEIEDRWTPISGSTAATADFVTLEATEDGSKIAFRNGSTKNKAFALRVRTDGPARLELTFGMRKSIELPDTNGEWRQVTVTLDASESLQDLVYIAATGDGTSVDVDSLDIAPSASGPELGAIPARVIGVVGSEASVSLPASEGSALRMGPMPEGASLEGTTLSWTPGAAGTHDALVTADDGSAIASRTVAFIAAEDRKAAIAAAADPHDDDAIYTRVTRDAYDAARLAAEGADPDAFPRALAELTAAADALRLVSPTVADGSLDYPELLASSTAGNNTGLLVDGDNQTGTVYSQAVDRAHVFDFGPFATVSASSFMLQSNIFEDRLANSAVFGSNDGTTWERLTPGITEMTQDEQTLDVAPELRDKRYHQLKVQLLEPLPDVLYGTKQGLVEFTEFHIFGERHEATGDIDAVSLSAPGSVKGRVVAGDAVRLDLHAIAAISDLVVTIAGNAADVTDEGDGSWSATTNLPADVAVGAPLAFTIRHTTHDGATADPVGSTTDGSSLYVSTDAGLVDDALAALPVTGEGGATSASITRDAANLFDSDTSTHSDTRLVGSQASLIWDLGEDRSLSIAGADVLVRQDQYGTSRLSGLRFEGSNDLSAWTPLTSNVVATPDWQSLNGLDGGAFRFIRLTNRNIINIAEVRLFGEVVTAPADPVWESGATYDDGDRVSYDGKSYVAQWWTKNEAPGSTATGAWMEEGAPAGDGVRAWTSSWVYAGGETVTHEGHLFRAKWWTRNQAPGAPNGPWEDLGTS